MFVPGRSHSELIPAERAEGRRRKTNAVPARMRTANNMLANCKALNAVGWRSTVGAMKVAATVKITHTTKTTFSLSFNNLHRIKAPGFYQVKLRDPKVRVARARPSFSVAFQP